MSEFFLDPQSLNSLILTSKKSQKIWHQSLDVIALLRYTARSLPKEIDTILYIKRNSIKLLLYKSRFVEDWGNKRKLESTD